MKKILSFVIEGIIAVGIAYLLFSNGIVRCGWDEPECHLSHIDGKYVYATQDYTIGIGKADFIVSRVYFYEHSLVDAAMRTYDNYEEHFVLVRKTT